jgi:hypothetical protein
MRFTPIMMTAIILLAACEKKGPVAKDANGATLPAPADQSVPDATGARPSGEQAVNPVVPGKAVALPAALQGRWGLTPADCTSKRGDAKGLLTISGGELRFYESRAVPGADVQMEPTSAAGTFNFTGEGQSWSRFQSLLADGHKLARTETNPAASFSYVKC